MRTTLAALGLAVATLLANGPARAGDCRAAALELLRHSSPGGWAVFQKTSDKGFFKGWLDCRDPELGLPTAVHESVHFITAETDAYPLVGGGEVRRPPDDPAFFHPSRLAGRFGRSLFVSTYLKTGGASSSREFRYLLDELNAYTHDLDTALHLVAGKPGRDGGTAHRDGLAALMAFAAAYVQAADEGDAGTWAGLRRPEVATAFTAIWDRAEAVMAASCRVPEIGDEDRPFLRRLCEPKPQASLRRLLGRPAACPTACLEPARSADAALE